MKNILLVVSLVLLPAMAMAEKSESEMLSALRVSTGIAKLEAITFFVKKATPEAYKDLAAVYNSEKDAYFRRQIIEGMDVNRSTHAFLCVMKAMKDPSLQVRQAAIASLAAYTDFSKVENDFKSALRPDTSKEVRLSAINYLSLNQSTRAVALVESAAAGPDSSEETKTAAKTALLRRALRATGIKTGPQTSGLDRNVAIKKSTDTVKSLTPKTNPNARPAAKPKPKTVKK